MKRSAIAAAAVLAAAGVSAAPGKLGSGKPLHYQKFAIPALLAKPIAAIPTRIEVSGVVVYKAREADGDIHLWICDTAQPPADELKPGAKVRKHCVVAEAMPDLPGPLPAVAKVKVGDEVTVDGISRFDGEHKWVEAAHPVERIAVTSDGRAAGKGASEGGAGRARAACPYATVGTLAPLVPPRRDRDRLRK